eukprot:scaffold205361_cov29-Prasinocladus_malaysianus.AAC.1
MDNYPGYYWYVRVAQHIVSYPVPAPVPAPGPARTTYYVPQIAQSTRQRCTWSCWSGAPPSPTRRPSSRPCWRCSRPTSVAGCPPSPSSRPSDTSSTRCPGGRSRYEQSSSCVISLTINEFNSFIKTNE